MNQQETLQQLRSLKLSGMAKRYETMLALPAHQQEDFHAALAQLCQAERLYRNQYRTERLLAMSKLRYHALLEEVFTSPERGLDRPTLLVLSEMNFIEKAENLILCGLTGTGKSYLACALGRQACLLGHRTLYLTMNKFLEALAQTRIDGTYLKWAKQLTANRLIILDDFGLKPLSHDAKLALLDLLEERYGNGSVIITSQLPVQAWYEFIDEPTLADAILDRLTASATKIELQGKSLRKRKQ